jgi:hypothetical protein
MVAKQVRKQKATRNPTGVSPPIPPASFIDPTMSSTIKGAAASSRETDSSATKAPVPGG